jgi:hypothetical protein
MKHLLSHATRKTLLGLATLATLAALPNKEANAQELIRHGAMAGALATHPARWQHAHSRNQGRQRKVCRKNLMDEATQRPRREALA